MKNLSLKLDDQMFNEAEKIISKTHKSRNRYINEAVEFYNLLQKRKLISN
jgi:metal-responsive CopG/Arc/MetJ family transcriptional regulator